MFSVPYLATYTYIFFLFMNKPELGTGINSGMALTPLPFSVRWDKILTHDLLIMSLAYYPLDQIFAPFVK